MACRAFRPGRSGHPGIDEGAPQAGWYEAPESSSPTDDLTAGQPSVLWSAQSYRRGWKENSVPRLLVRNFSISLDGYAAGLHQDLDNPLGIGGTQLHEWIFATRSGSQMIGNDSGKEGLDDDFFSKRESGVGATIMGRNMFGPIRGPWAESEWTGWWGEDPPFITQPSCSLTNRMLLSKCKGEQPSISSRVGSKKL